MKCIGVTGAHGFIGRHLVRQLSIMQDVKVVTCPSDSFADSGALQVFVRDCDVIIHLAAISRDPDEKVLYATNVGLVQKLIAAMMATDSTPLVMFASSSHENRETAYGMSKREGQRLFMDWANANNASYAGLVLPNVYGPGARVYHCSFVANFAYQLNHGIEPCLMVDAPMRLIYIDRLCKIIAERIDFSGIERVEIPWDFERKVSEMLAVFVGFKKHGFFIPDGFCETDARNLYATYVSYGEELNER